MEDTVPIIDFSAYGLQITNKESVADSDLETLAANVYHALSTVGFLYIKNHGLPQEKIDEFFRINKTFFTQPTSVKTTCESPTGGFNGYQAFAKERLDVSKPGDLKESFNYTSCEGPFDIQWPVSVPGMEAAYGEFYEQSTKLALRILDVISLCIGLSDRNFLRNCHQSFGSKKSPGTLRSLYYPILPAGASVKPGQLRCGEHSDYGTVTLLFQDQCGGLEIVSPIGEFMPVIPIEGTIVVNIGDLMQRWTADKLKATVHRVIIPHDEKMKACCRQSVALFVDPDDDVVIECLDGSNKYKPVTSRDYVGGRLRATYQPA
ncbi:uncharacterized protein [Haliotis cracherodii]|uniref:uncharacterized protein n=1 Tax=Haliotis cracherodii TaxID=6455 RepID=UPI0039EB00D0